MKRFWKTLENSWQCQGPTLCKPMDCSTPGFPVHHQLPELAQTHVHYISDAIQPSHPLLSPSPPAFNLFRVFSNESALLNRWPKYWSFSISPSDESSGSISFKIDWSDLLAIHVTRSSILLEKPGLCSLSRGGTGPNGCAPLNMSRYHLHT